jgi:ubiquinone biosynthesis protein COQ4
MASELALDTRLHPLVALRAIRALLKGGGTEQIFVIFRAMRGRSGIRSFQRFRASPAGQAILKDRRDLYPVLTDREALRQLPQGSLGHTYLDFMEAENLSAQELVQASQVWENDPVPPDVELYRARMRELHDVTHTVTGYGRDPLGELCLLAFMYRQQGNLGMLMVVMMAWRQLPKRARAAVREAWRNGRKASWLPGQDWEDLLARPLEEIRRRLSIAAPAAYQAITP